MRAFRHALCAALCSLAAGLAAAQSHDFAPYRQAAAQLRALPAPARLAEPHGAALLAVLGDSQRFLGGAPFGPDELPVLMEICDVGGELASRYMVYDLDAQLRALVKDRKDAPAVMQAAATVAGRNTIEFQDEISLLMAFNYRCMARQLPLLADYVMALPPEQITAARIAGLRQLQQGTYTGFIGLLQLVAEGAFLPANQQIYAQAMAEAAPALAAVLPLATRQQLHARAVTAESVVSGPLAADMTRIRRAMEDTTCHKLCAL